MEPKTSVPTTDNREPFDPGPETVDPAPLLGQVGEGATIESGEAIAREVRRMTERAGGRNTDEKTSISADPEMPIPSPGDEE
jgi:hypothetical protein